MRLTITLTRINGSPFELDARTIISMSQRRDGGTNLNAAGKRTPCKESILEIAQKINDCIKEAAQR